MTQAEELLERLDELGVPSELVDVINAPQLTRFMIKPASPKVRMQDYRRLNRADDLAYVLEAQRVRIIAPVPGRSVVAIETDRKDRRLVSLADLPRAVTSSLCVPIGIDTENRPTILDIGSSPHVMISGTTGSGKTTCLHTILCSLLKVASPDQLQLLLLDAKRTELVKYEHLPHVAAPIADSPQEAIRQLEGAVLTMERRFGVMHDLGAKDITEANEIIRSYGQKEMPLIMIVADEMAELIMTGPEAESLIIRLAQKGRSAGIHLVLATQYPKREIISGLMRANLPTKIAFSVSDAVASRVALGENGAEKLLGRGDGLLSFAGLPSVRFQSAYASEVDTAEIIERWL